MIGRIEGEIGESPLGRNDITHVKLWRRVGTVWTKEAGDIILSSGWEAEEFLEILERGQQKPYPYAEGETVVLGPEIFASKDGQVISWKGENYYRRAEPLTMPADEFELVKRVKAFIEAVREIPGVVVK